MGNVEFALLRYADAMGWVYLSTVKIQVWGKPWAACV